MICPFLYSEVDDIEFEIVPEQTIYLLIKWAHANTPDPKKRAELGNAIKGFETTNDPQYYMFYRFRYKDRRQTNNYGTFCWRNTISMKNTHEITTYMRNMFKLHAKCFIVP